MDAAVTMHEASDASVAADVGEGRHEPLRRCIVTRSVRPRRELLRLVIAPDGAVVPDIEGRLPGRGLWITPSRMAFAEASKRGHFAKAAKQSVTAPPDLAERAEAAMVRRCLDLLGLARRAGQAAAGFEKVRAWLADGKAGLLIQAVDASPDGKRKLQAMSGGARVIEALTGVELAAALGRDTVVHVAVAPGRLAARLADEAGRLMEMRREQGHATTPAGGSGESGRQESDRNEK